MRPDGQSFLQRLWVYLAERFPLEKFGIMVSMFALSGLCFSQMLRGVAPLPSPLLFLTTAVVTLLVFFQLRVADEFKDYADDCLYQSYRAVPRGLITLKELGILAFILAVVRCQASFAVVSSMDIYGTYDKRILCQRLVAVPYYRLRGEPYVYYGFY
jgi:4-hydroxybenzoate polyprenyltransferase